MQLPARILTLYNTPAYEGSGETVLLRADFEAGRLTIHLKAITYEDSMLDEPVAFTLTFEEVVRYRLSERTWDNCTEYKKHPLLDEFTAERATLYIARSPTDPGAALLACIRALAKVVPAGTDGLTHLGLSASGWYEILQTGFGQVLEGERRYVEVLAEALRPFNTSPSILRIQPRSKRKYANGEHWSEPYVAERLHLIMFAENWVIWEAD